MELVETQTPSPEELKKAFLESFTKLMDDPELKGFVLVKIKTTGDFSTHLNNINAQELSFAGALISQAVFQTLARPTQPLPPT